MKADLARKHINAPRHGIVAILYKWYNYEIWMCRRLQIEQSVRSHKPPNGGNGGDGVESGERGSKCIESRANEHCRLITLPRSLLYHLLGGA